MIIIVNALSQSTKQIYTHSGRSGDSGNKFLVCVCVCARVFVTNQDIDLYNDTGMNVLFLPSVI